MDEALFFAFTVLAVLSALLAVTRKNAVAAACWLVVMFFGIAGVFILQEAYFNAAAQILVYAGAIMVLFLFVIMLLDLRSVELAAHQGPKLKVAGVLLAGVFLAAVLYAISDAKDSPRIADRVGLVLRRGPPPLPAQKPDDDPLHPPAALPRPAPEVIELSGTTPDVTEVAGVPSRVGQTGDRSFAATFPRDVQPTGYSDPAETAPAVRRVTLTLAPEISSEGSVTLSIDGTRLDRVPFEPADPKAHERHASYAVPDAPAGTMLDVTILRGGLDASASGGPDGSPRAIGRAIFEVWLLPFEVASILLTGAIFGAVVLTKRRLA
jgi:NADH:ubiquinone oxidoreductase subunit 6 (subunit J)